MKHVVKRRGRSVEYEDKKIYASVYAAALNCHYAEQDAETTAELIRRHINVWISDKEIVTSDQIRDEILRALADDDIALMYKSHLDVC